MSSHGLGRRAAPKNRPLIMHHVQFRAGAVPLPLGVSRRKRYRVGRVAGHVVAAVTVFVGVGLFIAAAALVLAGSWWLIRFAWSLL